MSIIILTLFLVVSSLLVPSLLPSLSFTYSYTDYADHTYNRRSIIKELSKEKIEQSVLTICETLKALRSLAGCYGGNFEELMGFMKQGTAYSGTLQNLSSLPQTSTFSCTDADSYGRFLLFRTLSDYEVQNYGYHLEPVGLDPCGVADFVYWRG